jgi:mRNA interferase MazF
MARVLRRGDVVWADLNPTRGNGQAGRRPVLVLSREVFNARSGTVIAAAITSQPQRAGFPLTMKIESARLPKESWVKIGQIRTLSTTRVGNRLGRVSPEELATAVEGLGEIIGD